MDVVKTRWDHVLTLYVVSIQWIVATEPEFLEEGPGLHSLGKLLEVIQGLAPGACKKACVDFSHDLTGSRHSICRMIS